MEINRNNYETFFLLYLDRELKPSEMSEVEKFVNENADLQKEFSLLRQTILIPTQTEFDQKELLFRKEKRRVIPFYWIRMAAAVAVLVFGGWLMTIQLSGKQGGALTAADSNKKTLPGKKSNSGQKLQEANSNKSDLSKAPLNEIQPAGQQNITNTTNQSSGNSATAKVKPESDLSGKNNPVQSLVSVNPSQRNPSSREQSDGSNPGQRNPSSREQSDGSNPALQNPSSREAQDGSNVAMQKSSAQDLQPVNSQNATEPKQISAMPGSHAPVMMIAATGTAENVPHVRDENAVLPENEDQTDNAISVIALNDKNKGITKLFKKLTARTPADENVRKVRVSVFQFNY